MTAIAMLAFAANSLLCRLALGEELVDAASFTAVRVIAGALVLLLLLLPGRRVRDRLVINWRSGAMLVGYMIFFSFAYLTLSAGTGALILFGAVQLTMLIVAFTEGERLRPLSWFGLAIAVGGLVYLVSPGVTAPDPLGALLMAIAGISWGLYSLLGRRVVDPLSATAGNFVFAVPFVILISLVFIDEVHLTTKGIILAMLSGAIASGLGYAIWYVAIRGLTASRAATIQLSVPIIAAIGGVVALSEDVTLRLLLASVATLGGVWLVLAQRTTD